LVKKINMTKTADGKEASRRIIRRLARGGRRLAAFIFDAVFIWLAIFGALYLAARSKLKNGAAALLFALSSFALAFTVWLAAYREAMCRKEEKLRAKARRGAAEAKLMLDPSPVLLKAVEAGAFVIGSTDLITSDELRRALEHSGEGKLTLVSFGKPTEAAREFLSALPYEVKLMTPCDFLGRAPEELAPVSEEELDGFLIRRYGKKERPDLKAGLLALSRGRAAKYAAAGIGLMLLSFFVRYSLLYRLMGSLTLSLGAGIFALETIRDAKRAP
jgi:hypothetical protein